jgi:transposase-like protein
MPKDEETLRIWKRHFDNLCPYCSSRLIYKTGAYGTRASSSPKYPEANIEVWLCEVCKKNFELA